MVVHVLAYGVEVDLFPDGGNKALGKWTKEVPWGIDPNELPAYYSKHLAAACSGFSADAPGLQTLCVRAVNRELDGSDFSQDQLPRAALDIIERVGEDGRRGESSKNDGLYVTIVRVQQDFVVAACRALDIELGPFPVRRETEFAFDSNQEFHEARQAWYNKCPFRLIVDLGNTCDNPGYGELTEICATVTVNATKVVRQGNHRRQPDDYGPGVSSQRPNLDVPVEQSRQLSAVIAALRIKTTRPPGWLRVTVDNM